ncbi:hypothetical protein AKUH3B209X_09240 [Apilactobacillus kunkeei]|nr:hypothetical protein AKUG0406_09270 [Apilactobacillus kunkeei]CAI2615649.1 hypothetical protein AKUH3B102A_09340 [Apilactobacillus kunkeei]CAI2617119.1 hypothetical protein AKUG0403_09270 [Apilactobacillus kunkeei]CAI2617953.1 hypothetical protein AKUH4B405J_09500 [Apilactobacillus kunkeei]CAI2618440.1 hypothetical protein AKUH3B209X_09240 [Apilactobacillus kunkeei]
MYFISMVFAFLFYASIVIFFVNRHKYKKSDLAIYKKNRKKILIAMVSSFLLSGLFYTISPQSKQDAIQDAREEQQQEKEEKKEEKLQKQKKDDIKKISNDSKKKKASSISTNNSSSSDMTADQQNALITAENYSDSLHLSKADIYDQLTSSYGDKFSPSDAKFAVDNLEGVNWNQNALETAKNYLNNLHLSKNDIYDQLTSQYGGKFTSEQANYAVNHLN